ncbi:palmitoyltransferase ZDHHC16-like isoform X2 [Patiria miniata]|uniref:Palmitoyltransferase n=1 Tax=Patiria miniata TaxID=46514 RepID=A0A914B4J8_PATMI|nr:palmitoyltransferase ZDHHC16-like isoform X2 [Patiria miniata]
MKGQSDISLTIPASSTGSTNYIMDYDTDKSRRRRNVCSRVCDRYRYIKFCLRSLTYNFFTNRNMVLDTCMEPLFWLVNHITRYMGPLMVVLVTILSSTVVSVVYICILPRCLETEAYVQFTFHLIFGHWLLVNIAFHYYKGVRTPPGYPPQIVPDTGVATICKKCIAPKPPRTHHCSICNKCILRMDHHCPWINNCVGHYNYRYFILFCIYMWTGTLYVCISAWPLFSEEFFDARKTFDSLLAGSVLFTMLHSYKVAQNKTDPLMERISALTDSESAYHKAVVFQFIICFSVLIALGVLTAWHIRLISRGETSIEKHINDSERARLKKVNVVYKNPYNFGVKENWRMLLGLYGGRTFWLHVLLPSSHPPEHDGTRWESLVTPGYVSAALP